MKKRNLLFDNRILFRNRKNAGQIFLLSVCLVFSLAYPGMRVSATEEEHPATGPDWSINPAAAPAVVAESAVLMDVDTGVSLYEKNIHTRQYPASITKILTCVVARENSELTDIVTFSHNAVFGIERGSNNIGIDEGEQLAMEDALYATLLESANEVAAGIAEHVGGSPEGFARMMNDKVRELGGTDSNFVNANGLPDENHYTSAWDMALIGRAFFQDDILTEISGTPYYHISSSPTQKDEIDLRNHHRMLPGCQLSRRQTYEYTIGGKTGFTTAARQTLVTCAEKNGHRLVCVVLKDETPNHYLDTIALFDYGFACYEEEAIRSQLDERAAVIRAEEEAKAKEKAAEEEKENTEEISQENKQADTIPQNPDSGLENPDAGKQKKEGKGIGFIVLIITIVMIVFAAAAACGYIFYKSYQRELERKRRRAEIMARHRARKAQQDKE